MNRVSQQARSGSTGSAWEKGARAGFAVSGLLHLVLGVIIARIAFGANEDADQGAALASIGDSTFGGVILWVSAAALFALGTWHVADALRGGKASERAVAAGKAAVYVALAGTAVTIAMGSGGSDGDSQAQGFAGTLMEAPAGRLLVGAIGLGIVAAGGFHVYRGVTRGFRDSLRMPSSRRVERAVTGLGVAGYSAKGVALGVVGALFTYAAFTADASEASGIDGAIDSLLDAPGGPVIVLLVGIGFAAFGLYSFARARYARMEIPR